MKISIIHPSRGRSEQCYQTVKKWVTNASNIFHRVELEYIVSVDFDDNLKGYLKIQQENLAWLLPNHNKTAIEAINNAAKHATGDLIMVVSDDFDCPKHWASIISQILYSFKDYLVKTNDGIQPTLITLPIMDRAYYNRFGYIYHPDYLHMFSDQEMTAVGHMLGRVLPIDMEFKHNHYTVGGMVKDAINAKNDATWTQGQNLFNQRLKSNFGLSSQQIVKPYGEIVWR